MPIKKCCRAMGGIRFASWYQAHKMQYDRTIFVIEYRGAHLFSNEDSKEKRTIGSVWAAASAGKCVFAMVTDIATAGKSVAAQLKGAVG